MPPAPMAESMRYGPSDVPASRLIGGEDYTAGILKSPLPSATWVICDAIRKRSDWRRTRRGADSEAKRARERDVYRRSARKRSLRHSDRSVKVCLDSMAGLDAETVNRWAPIIV